MAETLYEVVRVLPDGTEQPVAGGFLNATAAAVWIVQRQHQFSDTLRWRAATRRAS